MNPHDYIVSVDEYGEPYISHALFGLGKGGQKQNHKYYARAEDKGRWRYFYSPEEFRAWASGGSKRKVSTSDKMRSAFKQIKETGRKAAETAADKLGVDERRAAQEAWSQVPKHVKSSDKKAMKALKKATAANDAYFKTPLGKAESLKDRIEEDARGLVSDVADRVKSKSDRMKEEFRKKAVEAANNVKDKAKSKIDDVKESYQHNKEAIAKAEELDKAETERESVKTKRPAVYQKPEANGTAKENALTRRTTEKSKYSEYTKGDSDFDDNNYKEENRVGDTDFFVHKRKDGTNVILEEDMKWVLPKGIDAKSPEIQKAIQDFASHVESARKLGENYTGDQWTEEVTKAIDDAVRNTSISGTKSRAEEPYLSEEYLKRLEFNSKKNKY